MTGRRQVDEPPAIADERRNPVDQNKVTQVIRSELCFEAIGSVAKRRGHHSGVGAPALFLPSVAVRGLGHTPRRASTLSAVAAQEASLFHAEAGRNTGH